MNTSSRGSAPGTAILVFAIASAACSSSKPLKKTGDAAAAPELGADVSTERDASPDIASPDLASADSPSPDLSVATKDVSQQDTVPIKDTVESDLFLVKDVAATELATFSADVPLTDGSSADAPARDMATADLASRDGATDRPLPCTPGANQTCNDNLLVSSIWGTCQPDGTCICTTGHVVNPSTGRCMMAPINDASAGGDTGQSACTGDYTACGCGCCGGVQANPSCYYPSLGETIAAITAQDLATKSATNCSLVGCSVGIHYVCCPEAAPESPSSATYAADGYSGGLDHVTISTSGSDCATVSFARPMSSTGSSLKIATPSSWGVVSGGFGACGDAGVMDQARGAVGTLALRASGSQCVADLHATLFAFAADGTVKTTRLDVDAIPVTGFPGSLCQ